MQFIEGKIYHIYNRGNNRRRIFFSHRNYQFFIEKMAKYICSNADLLAWTLMPNHFHFLVHANVRTCSLVKHTPIEINALTEGIRLLLSSYTKAIQRQEHFKGNLFQQKTKVKCVSEKEGDYSSTAFHYIHQNAYKAGIVQMLEEWKYSSLPKYLDQRVRDTSDGFDICNMELACELLNLDMKTILEDSYSIMVDEESSDTFKVSDD